MIVGVGSGIGWKLSEALQCHCRGAHEPSCDGYYSNDLVGQVIGITRYNSSTHAVAAPVFRKLGLETAATLRPMEIDLVCKQLLSKGHRKHDDHRKAEGAITCSTQSR